MISAALCDSVTKPYEKYILDLYKQRAEYKKLRD